MTMLPDIQVKHEEKNTKNTVERGQQEASPFKMQHHLLYPLPNACKYSACMIEAAVYAFRQ